MITLHFISHANVFSLQASLVLTLVEELFFECKNHHIEDDPKVLTTYRMYQIIDVKTSLS